MRSTTSLPALGVLGLAGLALAACGPRTEFIELNPAELEVNVEQVEFGLLSRGEKLDKEIVISNPGDVSLGIRNIYLVTSGSQDVAPQEDRGHPGSFRLLWNCGDIEVPNLDGDTDDQTAKGRPAIDSGDTGIDTGDSGVIDTGGTPTPTGDCVLPAGGRLKVRVRFSPQRAGDNWDSIIIDTYGDQLEGEELLNTAVDEITYRDIDNTWRQIFVHGEGRETQPRALITPRTVDFGYVFDDQTENGFITVRNDGDGELGLADVSINRSDCAEGFELVYEPEGIISGKQAKVAEVSYTPVNDRAAQCRVSFETYDPRNPSETTEITDVLLLANTGTNPANQPPRVVIHSPAPGYQHQGLNPLPLELTVFDTNEPADGLYCKIRSGLQGLKDSRPALADCRPDAGNPSGHLVVGVPVDFYVKPGLEVLLVRVTDSSGVTREASLPVLLNAAYPESDDDGDGFGTEGEWRDCDDTNPNIHPLAAEAFDGRDNDCDRLIDEGTDGFDDDGDGMTEAEGDCNDANPDTYLGAPEIRDRADNDCDGIADENTAAYDDDGDGYTELEQDCNDADPSVSPGADELCDDGIDNDCDRILDENDPGGCISTETSPMIVGRIDLSRTAIEEGDTIQAFVQVYEEDGDNVTYEWEVKDGAGFIDDPAAPTINWTAPETISDPDLIGEIFTLYSVARDDDGNQSWAFEEVWMYPEGDLDVALVKEVEVTGGSGCTSVPVAPVGLLAGLGLLVAGVRRRRD